MKMNTLNSKQFINVCVYVKLCEFILFYFFKRINCLVPRGLGIPKVLQAGGTTCRNITHTLSVLLISDCVYAQPW